CALPIYTRVGDGDAVVLLAERARAVLRVQLDPYPRGGVGPLLLQVLGGRHHGDLLHDVVVQQPRRQGQRERRLAGPGGGDRQEVARLLLDVLVHRPLLPGPQLAGGAPGGAAGERGRQVVRGRGGGGSHGLRRGGGSGGSATKDDRATLPRAVRAGARTGRRAGGWDPPHSRRPRRPVSPPRGPQPGRHPHADQGHRRHGQEHRGEGARVGARHLGGDVGDGAAAEGDEGRAADGEEQHVGQAVGDLEGGGVGARLLGGGELEQQHTG